MTSKKDKYNMLEDSFEQKYDELQDLLKDADDIYGTTIKNTKYRIYYPQGYLFVMIAQKALDLYDIASVLNDGND
ncbi:hypothetical protein P3S54_09385 [Lactobacillus delbrueckii]|uniref:hypothetical protein n=1 Tax=Lactobacillus delbrueckii TaxID=1584 RepID=UPI0023E354D6|nr:hypothetical protein [Lactobacillus delbrueckii]MDF4030497.1 hypothetical protein [Lactobacillus delbrueckii]